MNETNKPVLPIDGIDDAIRQIIGNPNCKISGCHGRGYIGIKLNNDNSHTVQLCSCGRWGETDFVVLSKKIEELNQSVKLYNEALNQLIEMQNKFNTEIQGNYASLYSHISSRFYDWFHLILDNTILRFFQKKNKIVPIKGKVKA